MLAKLTIVWPTLAQPNECKSIETALFIDNHQLALSIQCPVVLLYSNVAKSALIHGFVILNDVN